MLTKNNRKYSCGIKTRHIDMHYFFIIDRMDNKEVSINY